MLATSLVQILKGPLTLLGPPVLDMLSYEPLIGQVTLAYVNVNPLLGLINPERSGGIR